jgi:hypothetical protein
MRWGREPVMGHADGGYLYYDTSRGYLSVPRYTLLAAAGRVALAGDVAATGLSTTPTIGEIYKLI